MLTWRFQGLSTVRLLLLIHILSNPTFTYPVILNITTPGDSIIIGLGQRNDDNFDDNFVECVCGTDQFNQPPCKMPFRKSSQSPLPSSQALTAEHAVNYSSQTSFECEYGINKILCTESTESVCTSPQCTINIIIRCSKIMNVVLIWKTTQKPSVLHFTVVPVIDCCKTIPTTTEVTSMDTTVQTTTEVTTFITTVPSTNFIDVSSITFDVFPQSTSPTSVNAVVNSTHSESFNQQQGANEASSTISGQYIGIIVGTAVAAILITILIMCIFWKLKIRREKDSRKERTETSMAGSGNLEMNHTGDLRHPTSDRDTKPLKSFAHVAPLVQSSDSDNQITQTTGDYTYIDINSAASSNPNMPLTSPSPAVEENQQHDTAAEAVAHIQDNEYSQLGTHKIRLENPYNWLDHQYRATTIQPVIIPGVQRDNQQLRHDLETLTSKSTPSNHHVPRGSQQVISVGETTSLYSKLGVAKVTQDNTYNSLHNVHDESTTEPRFTQFNDTANLNSGIGSEVTSSPNHQPPAFAHSSKHKTMEIVDVTPCTYTEMMPKTKRGKAIDSSQFNENTNQEIFTTRTSKNQVPLPAKSSEESTAIPVPKDIVQFSSKDAEADVESRQAYSNDVYSMQEFLNEEHATYANIVSDVQRHQS